MTLSDGERATPPASLLTPGLIALGYFLLQLLTASRYGYFRDALYYLACSEIVIRVGEPIDDVRPSYQNAVLAATLDDPYALPYETRPILLCRGLKTNLQTVWPKLKNWD